MPLKKPTGGFPHNNPKVSIITVVFNGADYIEQTMQSVASQTYHNLEYIIIDGGSTDGTVEIIKKYASHLAYWHSKPDGGLAQAFNLGLAQAHGQWILFLHADDFLLRPTVVEEVLPHLELHAQADVVLGETIMMARQKNPLPVPFKKMGPRPWRWPEFRLLNTIPHQAAFTNRRYFERVGNFNETFNIALDYELYLREGKALRVQCIPLAVSGMREGGVSGKNVLRIYREKRRAQLSTKALPPWLAWINFFWRIGRFYLARLGHIIMDPFASKICYPGRRSGRLLSL